MRKIVLVIGLLCAFVQYAIADGYQTFHQAQVLFCQGKFSQAKTNFTLCLNDPAFADVKSNVNIWINKCESAIQEQNRNAQIAAERHKRKLAERKRDSLIYISVDGSDSGELYNRIRSAMSEVGRNNKRSFCNNVDDALTVVSVFLDVKPKDSKDGFYKMSGSGTVMLGSAIEDDFVGQWTVDCEATSVVDMEDAERLLMNKMNHKLGYALDNLLNGRPQDRGYYIPEQTVAVHLIEKDSVDISILREAMNGFISRAPGMTVSTVLDMERNKERDVWSKIEAEYVKMESRAPVHELEGFGQVLRLSVRSDGGSYTFIGELSENGTGISLATAIVNGEDFGITDLSSKSLELAAKLLAVGLGFKEWVIGEDIGGYKLASFNGMHGLLLHIADPNNTAKADIISLLSSPNAIELDNLWRYPHTSELLDMFKHRRELGLPKKVWSADSPMKKMFEVVDFDCKEETAPTAFKWSNYAAAIVLVKEF